MPIAERRAEASFFLQATTSLSGGELIRAFETFALGEPWAGEALRRLAMRHSSDGITWAALRLAVDRARTARISGLLSVLSARTAAGQAAREAATRLALLNDAPAEYRRVSGFAASRPDAADLALAQLKGRR